MNFLEPQPTAWDLRWTMFGVPVRVHPMFWLISLLMGQGAFRIGPQYLLIWIACVFVSILVHELGHVFMGSMFGSHGHIVLYSFGGLAIGSNRLRERWQRIAVCFAGPAAGFVFLAVILGLTGLLDPAAGMMYVLVSLRTVGIPATPALFGGAEIAPVDNDLLNFLIINLIFVNLLWGLVNLLPVWPLDGGQISRDVCEGASRRNGLRTSLMISVGVAGALAVLSLLSMAGRSPLPFRFGDGYTALLFGLLAFQSFQLLQQVNAESRWMDDHWQR